MTPDRLQEIRQRLEKATPGKWEKRPGNVEGTDRGQPLLKRDGTPIHAVAIRGATEHSWTWITTACERNVDFIAHAPQDIADLLAALATAEAEGRRQGIKAALDAVSGEALEDPNELDAGDNAYRQAINDAYDAVRQLLTEGKE